MKKYLKGMLFILGAVALVIAGLVIKNTEFAGYAILGFTGAAILLVLGIFALFTSSNPTKLYENKVRNILNTYDSILVKSNTIPSLEGRNVVNVEKMEDLVDAQLELRKPICYLKQTESCSFILLDDKEAFVYVEKLNDDVVTPVEIELKELKIKEKDRDDMDSEMLKAIDKTTVVKLSNKKSYKVSPIRKKKDENVEETVETEVEEPKDSEVSIDVPETEEHAFQLVAEEEPADNTPAVEPENVEVPAPVQESTQESGFEQPSTEDIIQVEKESRIKEDDEVI